jgi:hypothetical protein
MRNTVLIFVTILFSISVLLPVSKPVQAADLTGQITGQISAGADKAGFGEARDPRKVIAEIVKVALGLVGTFFTITILMASYWYLTARGDEQKVEKATKTIRGAIIGLVIVLMAYSITSFVSSRTQKALKQSDSLSETGALGERRSP